MPDFDKLGAGLNSMPGDTAGIIEWFGQMLAMLFDMIKKLFGSLGISLGGKEEGTTEEA